jgi:hypothetical protein
MNIDNSNDENNEIDDEFDFFKSEIDCLKECEMVLESIFF